MNTLSRRERILVGAALVVALLIGIPGLLLDGGAGLGRKVGSAAEEKQKQREVMANLSQAQEEIERLEGEIDQRIFEGTPRQLVSRMVQASQVAAGAAKVRVNDLKPLPVEKAGELNRVPVRISLTTRFPAAVRFLYEMERAGARYDVDQLQLTATDVRSDQLEIELRLVGYVKPEGEGENVEGS